MGYLSCLSVFGVDGASRLSSSIVPALLGRTENQHWCSHSHSIWLISYPLWSCGSASLIEIWLPPQRRAKQRVTRSDYILHRRDHIVGGNGAGGEWTGWGDMGGEERWKKDERVREGEEREQCEGERMRGICRQETWKRGLSFSHPYEKVSWYF